MTSFSRLQPMKIPYLLYNFMRSRVKIPLKFTFIAKLLVLATPVSVCIYNGVVENDDLLSLFTINRKLPMATDIRSEFSDCQWYQFGNQWQPMVQLVKLRTREILAVSVIRWTSKICKSRIQQIEIFCKLYNISTDLTVRGGSSQGALGARAPPLCPSTYPYIVCSMLEAPWIFRQIKGTLSIL